MLVVIANKFLKIKIKTTALGKPILIDTGKERKKRIEIQKTRQNKKPNSKWREILNIF